MPDVDLSTLGSVIKTAYEGETNTNAYTDAEKSKLSGIEDNATANQTGSEIKVAYESQPDTNAFTNAEQLKLSNIEAFAKDDQTAAEIEALLDAEFGNTDWKTGGSGVITAGDLGFALTGNPVDGDDGARLQILLETIEDSAFRPVRIQFVQDNATDNADLKFYCNSSVAIPSYVELDFGNAEIVFGGDGRLRFQGRQAEIRPGDRVLPTPTGNLARLESSVTAGSTTIELNNTDPSSDPSLFNVGEYIVLRGENDAGGQAIERDIVQITDITDFVVTFTPALEFGYEPEYPGSISPTSPDRTTISIRKTYTAEGDMLATTSSLRVPAEAASSLVAGDWVSIEDNQFITDIHPDTPSANKVNFEMLQIKEVDATPGSETLTFARDALNDYLQTNDTVVTKIEVVRNSKMMNARATYLEPQVTRNNHPFESRFAINCQIDNCHVERNWTGGFAPEANSHRLYASVGCTVTNCSTLSPADPSNGGESYGVTVYYSYGCKVHNYLAQGCRHSLLLQGASRNIITNFTSHDCSISDMDLHGINERENIISDFTVVGGPTISNDATSHTGIKLGNTFHLFGSFNNIIQNGIVRLGDDPAKETRGIELLPNSDGNTIRNIKMFDMKWGLLMTDQSRNSDGSGPDQFLTMERNSVSNLHIENTSSYGVRIKSNNANAGANTDRVTTDLMVRNVEMRNCGGGVLVEQTDRVHLDNFVFIDQTGTESSYAMRFLDNTNLIARNMIIVNGAEGIAMNDCPDAYIDNVLFDLSGSNAFQDNGGNTSARITNMQFKGATATHDLTGASPMRTLTNADRLFVRVDSAIATNFAVTDPNQIISNSFTPPLVTEGVEIATATVTPVSPATVLNIEVVIPTVASSGANEPYTITLFDGSTCIGAMQHTVDLSGAKGHNQGTLSVSYPITGWAPRTISARFGPRDAGVTMTLYSRWTNTTLSRPYMTISDLGIVS